MRVNIAIAGGPCTGKSTLAAALFATLKEQGFDVDLVTEEGRKLREEMGPYRTTFERLYMWRQQEREELRSRAADGFVTDSPLIQSYVSARMHSTEPRDKLAVRELLRMCLELDERYQLIVMAADPFEIPYKNDHARRSDPAEARRKHHLGRTFVEHFWPEKIVLVHGPVRDRIQQVLAARESYGQQRASP
jgi:predicted ATPase